MSSFISGRLVLVVIFIIRCLALEVFYKIKSPDCGYKDVKTTSDILQHVIDMHQYGFDASINTSFNFEVKACSQVAVYATEKQNVSLSTEIYSIYIGGGPNEWNKIINRRHGYSVDVALNYGAYANCAEYIQFWFSWADGEIRAGLGNTVNTQTKLSYKDADPFDVNGLGISTCWGATGEWKIWVNVKDRFSGFFSNCKQTDTKAEITAIASLSTSSVICAAKCSAIIYCYGFNFHEHDRKCELLSTGGGPLTGINRIVLAGWNFYAKCYRKEEVCVGCFF